ncbi:MAG: 3-deoxy-manno-octulosonate cytidylyltransferase [Thermovirgaceae bacterium]|nr:3-deoxy-manno-octulosonate cytidylyltransferase [Thermovirgaceae bacterium]
MKTLVVIPARYASTRLPGKPLLSIAGIPLVVRVLRQASRCTSVTDVLVATDDQRIADVVRAEGGQVMMTPPELPSGGDRVAFAAREYGHADVVFNIQVDDPLVGPDMIDPLVDLLAKDPSVSLGVLAKAIEDKAEEADPGIVKMVFDENMRALYFSRSPIPFRRNPGAVLYKHIGPYAFRRDFLLQFCEWGPTPLERSESLEMLRVLEKGHEIRCLETSRDTIEVDSPGDIVKLEAYILEHGDDLA